jgi:uncharacterized membrane protein
MAPLKGFMLTDVTTDGLLMLSLGSVLFCFEPLLTNPKTANNGYVLAIVLTSACLFFAGFRFVRAIRGASTHHRVFYSLIAEFILACAVAVWIVESSPIDLRILDLLAGVHGILWGIWLLKLALQFQTRVIKAALVSLLAALTSASGVLIAVQPGLTKITALTLVSCYTMSIGLVIVSLELFLYRSFDVTHDDPVAPAIKEEARSILHPATR